MVVIKKYNIKHELYILKYIKYKKKSQNIWNKEKND